MSKSPSIAELKALIWPLKLIRHVVFIVCLATDVLGRDSAVV